MPVCVVLNGVESRFAEEAEASLLARRMRRHNDSATINHNEMMCVFAQSGEI